MTQFKRNKDLSKEVFSVLGQEKLLQEYCQSIYKMLGFIIDFVSVDEETECLSGGCNFNPFCTIIRATPAGQKACHQCDVANALRAAKERKALCYRCHAGLYEIIVPLFDQDKTYLGCLTSGQFRLKGSKDLSSHDLNTLANICHILPELLAKAYHSSPVISVTQQEGVIQFLQILGEHLVSSREKLLFLKKINTPSKIESITEYIEQNYRKKLSLGDVARKFYVSPSYLAHTFKQKMHVSFTRYINCYRIDQARDLLKNTELPVSEIAVLCGFGSISQFNRTFLSENHISAQQYRLKN